MIELIGVETSRTGQEYVNPSSQLLINKEDGLDLKAGDEVLVLVKHRPEQKREDYGVALRITDENEAGENDVVLQYGDRLLIAEKLPEFI